MAVLTFILKLCAYVCICVWVYACVVCVCVCAVCICMCVVYVLYVCEYVGVYVYVCVMLGSSEANMSTKPPQNGFPQMGSLHFMFTQ